MALNVDIRGYYDYSFETVKESDSGHLLEAFLEAPIPRLFLYGEANRTLSYLPRLRGVPSRSQRSRRALTFFSTITRWTHSKPLVSSSMRRFRITPPNEITVMKQIPIFLLLALAIFPAGAPGQEAKSTATPDATPQATGATATAHV